MSLTVDFGNCAWEKIEVFVEKERYAMVVVVTCNITKLRRQRCCVAALLVAITAAQLWMKYFRAAGLLYRKPPERFRGGTVNATLKGSHSLLWCSMLSDIKNIKNIKKSQQRGDKYCTPHS
ncbi:hypothetical protein EAF00_000660 [Botryotinia globosa]|nr:hypothetical protein EAF00_000660 [Botryotinia globosa]